MRWTGDWLWLQPLAQSARMSSQQSQQATVRKKRTSVAKRLVLDNDENRSKKLVVRDGYDCIDFLPTKMRDAETDESLNSKQKLLKDMHASAR